MSAAGGGSGTEAASGPPPKLGGLGKPSTGPEEGEVGVFPTTVTPGAAKPDVGVNRPSTQGCTPVQAESEQPPMAGGDLESAPPPRVASWRPPIAPLRIAG